MNKVCATLFLAVAAASTAHAAEQPTGRVELLCHRTANQEVPENTLESLQQAALLGCNLVELDIRRTLDGQLVLNHDGILERLTDGTGEAETTYYDDLRLRDAGSWMGERFTGLHITRFEDALRMAREQNIRLYLDMKTKGIGPQVLQLLEREGMLQRVVFGGEWDDVKHLYPEANAGNATNVWVQPGVTAEQIQAYHRQGKSVIVNFSANDHEMDLASMKASVAAGADGINVDYPRLGADAVGRPVERKLNALAVQANTGESSARSKAILALSQYRGFPLQPEFAHWLLDADDRVSRAAAVALVTARPQTSPSVFAEALQSQNPDARANAAWALGMLPAPAATLLPLLNDKDPYVLQQALIALARMPGEIGANSLLPLLANEAPSVRGAAALALARHQPDIALHAIPPRFQLEVQQTERLGEDYQRRNKPQLTQPQIDEITGHFRCEMKMIQALSMLKGPGAMQVLEELSLRPSKEFTAMNGLVAGFQLWDRIGADAQPAVQALASADISVANRAEWILIHAGPAVLPDVRIALGSDDDTIRQRAIRIVAWLGDAQSLDMLRSMQKTDTADSALAAWAIDKIASLNPKL
jgi:HEAT repeat protein